MLNYQRVLHQSWTVNQDINSLHHFDPFLVASTVLCESVSSCSSCPGVPAGEAGARRWFQISSWVLLNHVKPTNPTQKRLFQSVKAMLAGGSRCQVSRMLSQSRSWMVSFFTWIRRKSGTMAAHPWLPSSCQGMERQSAPWWKNRLESGRSWFSHTKFSTWTMLPFLDHAPPGNHGKRRWAMQSAYRELENSRILAMNLSWFYCCGKGTVLEEVECSICDGLAGKKLVPSTRSPFDPLEQVWPHKVSASGCRQQLHEQSMCPFGYHVVELVMPKTWSNLCMRMAFAFCWDVLLFLQLKAGHHCLLWFKIWNLLGIPCISPD